MFDLYIGTNASGRKIDITLDGNLSSFTTCVTKQNVIIGSKEATCIILFTPSADEHVERPLYQAELDIAFS